MITLLFPIMVVLLVIETLFAFITKRWIIGAIIALLTILLNTYSKCFAYHLGGDIEGSDFRVLCYNINSFGEEFDERAIEIAKIIQDEHPDFVFLTEYYENKSDTILAILSKCFHNIDVTNRWDANEGDVFLSSWQIDNMERIKLPYIAHSIYRLQVSHSTDTLSIYCCHLTSNLLTTSSNKIASIKEGYRRRAKEADLIYDNLIKDRFPAIVMGDFNDLSGSYTIRRIERADMKDAWWDGGLGYGTTYHGHHLRLRLDHILYNGTYLSLCDIKTVGDNLSDHKALTGSFRIKR